MRRVIGISALFLIASAALARGGVPRPVRPTALEVNTKDDEDEPHVAGNQLFYSSNAGGKFHVMVASRRSPLDVWGKGKAVDGLETQADSRGAYLYVQKDGFQYLFFATRYDNDNNNFDIYVAQRFDPRKAFSAMTPVQSVDSPSDEMHPWLTADGKEMYFSRKKDGHWRVFVASRPANIGPQFSGEARELKELPDDFHHATLSQDGKTMYLQGPVGNGRWGIFRSTRTGSKWSAPEELTMLNDRDGPTGDRSPALSREAGSSTLYFASDRPGGKRGLDLYSVPVSSLRK
jgi:hypothetical protein